MAEPKWRDYTLVVLSLVALASLGYNVMPEPNHYCESRELSAYCVSMSSTAKTCYTMTDRTGGKRCTEGWKEIVYEPKTINTDCRLVVAYTDNGKFFCNGIGSESVCVNEEFMQVGYTDLG